MTFVQRLRSLRQDTSGLALMEFAFTLPLVLAMGGYGTELSFLALSNLRVSQYALNLADNASRIGVSVGGGVSQLREIDLNDVLQGTRKESESLKLTTNGRVILSSLENTQQSGDSNRVQRIHWQRCIGLKSGASFDSHYGTTSPTDGTTTTGNTKGTAAPSGMGEAGRKVNAFQDSGAMFVEINYQYTPIFSAMFVSPRVIRYSASFTVRDNRDFTRVYNPSPTATMSTCDKYAA